MAEYVVTASKLNLRGNPVDGVILTVLPRGQILMSDGVSEVAGWPKVETSIASAMQALHGYVAERCAANVNASHPSTGGAAISAVSAEDESGVNLAKGQQLTSGNLRKIASLPRVAFVSACEAGRVRGQVATEATAFAELFLHSSVEAYLGTYCRVQDSAVASFATAVYTQLAAGETLEAAVLHAHKALLDANERDWANYMLFGGGGFRLVVNSRLGSSCI
jgi:hypothetical protein